jgi:hypothetical protein
VWHLNLVQGRVALARAAAGTGPSATTSSTTCTMHAAMQATLARLQRRRRQLLRRHRAEVVRSHHARRDLRIRRQGARNMRRSAQPVRRSHGRCVWSGVLPAPRPCRLLCVLAAPPTTTSWSGTPAQCCAVLWGRPDLRAELRVPRKVVPARRTDDVVITIRIPIEGTVIPMKQHPYTDRTATCYQLPVPYTDYQNLILITSTLYRLPEPHTDYQYLIPIKQYPYCAIRSVPAPITRACPADGRQSHCGSE